MQDKDGNTPLHAAALAKNIHLIDFTINQS